MDLQKNCRNVQKLKKNKNKEEKEDLLCFCRWCVWCDVCVKETTYLGTFCSEHGQQPKRTMNEEMMKNKTRIERTNDYTCRVKKNCQIIIIHFNKAIFLFVSGLLCTLLRIFFRNSHTCDISLLIHRTPNIVHVWKNDQWTVNSEQRTEISVNDWKFFKEHRPPLLIIWSHIPAKMTIQKQTIPFR